MTEERAEIEDYSSFQNFLSCSSVQDIEYEFRCRYVQNTTECQEKGYFFNYLDIMYCNFRPTSDRELYGYILIFLGIGLLIFWILAITADKFFCPALEVLSKALGLSEHLAGITLLAFGNGSPDLFTNLQSSQNDSMPLFSNVFSSAIFVTGFVGGIVCLIRPFHISGSGLIRDITFLLLGALYVNYIMESDKYVTFFEAVCFFSLYLFYIAIILTDLRLIKKSVNTLEQSMLLGTMSVYDYRNYVDLKEEASMEIIAQKSRAVIDIETTRASFYGQSAGPNENLVKQLLVSLNPIEEDDWSGGSFLGRALICLAAPVNFLLTLFIPSVDYGKERHGWSKLLNCTQIVTLPFISLCSIIGFDSLLGIPIILYILAFTIPVAFVIFLYTRTDVAPSFHVGFACLSAYGSIVTIYSCASEIVEVLYILGLVLDCSNSFLGCTLLAWGNGVGDMVANTALAMHGYHKMAFAACIGGPFFNTIFSFGLVLIKKTLQSDNGRVDLPPGPMGTNCYLFLLLILFGALMWSSTTNFQVRRSIGIFHIILYSLFLLYAILAEWEVIHTFTKLDDYGFD